MAREWAPAARHLDSVQRVVLGRAPGPVLHLLTLGATVHRLEVGGADGSRHQVALGHVDPVEYLASSDFIGSIVGRYANRIAGGRFRLDGKHIQVATSDRGNSLHGGPDGFDRRLWTIAERSTDEVLLTLVSPDGDQGFPGEVRASARYRVDADSVLLTMEATTDAPTVVNLTSHAYLNLDGDGSGSIDDHELQVLAEHYTPVDATSIPLGEHAPVAGTPFDLRRPTRLGPRIRDEHPQTTRARGLDHNFVLDGEGMRPAARLTASRTGVSMELHTDQPGLQVYTANAFDGTRRSCDGVPYRKGDGIALEPQVFPDSPNHPQWPSPVLRPGQTYRSQLRWRFSVGH